MMHAPLLLSTVILVALLASLQAGSQTTRRSTSAAAPPEYLNIVHQQFKPGRNTEYDKLLAAVAQGFAQARIGAYWVQWEFPQERTLSLNFFHSLEEEERVMNALASGMAAHPELVQMGDRLLSENVSSVNSVLGVRCDDLGYRSDSIDFSKARLLLATTISVRPGHEPEFEQVEKEKAAAYRKSNADMAWVIYQVSYGSTQPTFIALTPYSSSRRMEEALALGKAIEASEGGVIAGRISEVAQSAVVSIETQLYFVNPRCSHVPREFAAGDPEFWVVASENAAGPHDRR